MGSCSITAIIFILFITNGCAFTSRVPKNELSISYEKINTNPIGAWFSCTGGNGSVMVSPIIPLPPVIPVITSRSSELHLRFPEGVQESLLKIKITTKSGDTYLSSWDEDRWRTTNRSGSPNVRWYKNVNNYTEIASRTIIGNASIEIAYQYSLGCEKLDGGEIEISGLEYKGEKYGVSKGSLSYTAGTKFNAGYLGQ